jgi:hypothetical protein
MRLFSICLGTFVKNRFSNENFCLRAEKKKVFFLCIYDPDDKLWSMYKFSYYRVEIEFRFSYLVLETIY